MRIIWTERAKADRHRIWMFTADQNVERADRIDAKLKTGVDRLSTFPGLGRRAGRTQRELSITAIQLVARYRVDEDAIRILQVWHTRENREQP